MQNWAAAFPGNTRAKPDHWWACTTTICLESLMQGVHVQESIEFTISNFANPAETCMQMTALL